ncbi:MAG: hypothetical protein IT323_12700 [Anaerolineae bacterium]|nr:hypothetical protein [Anaerolineae bacterium]
MTQQPIRVLALSRKQDHHFAPLRSSFEVVSTENWSVDAVSLHSPDVLLTLSDDWYEAYAVINEAKRLNIPSLLMMDGIIEWRHQWEDPNLGAGGNIAYYQPVVTDKVACLGWLNARTLEAWGNAGKCEIVGAPRFDHYLEQPVAPPAVHDGPKHLLVMTANTPGFTPGQIAQVEQALCDVRDFLTNQREWQPIWRVTKGLDARLSLHDDFPHLRGRPLREVLAAADGVLATPSTVLLESMLAHRPTALLDYSNSPPYVSAAWSITAKAHIAPTLESLYSQDAKRLSYQDEFLHNYLECRTTATPRLVALVRQMAEIGREARAKGGSPVFPTRMLPLALGGHAVPSTHFDWARLYPGHPVFSQTDLRALQVELIHAKTEIKELSRLLRRAYQRTILYALARRLLGRR